MKLVVGSIAPPKIDAAKEALSSYFTIDSCTGLAVPSGVKEQPNDIHEMKIGSTNRAKKAYDLAEVCDLAVGLESGYHYLIGLGHVNFCVATLYDGTRTYHGLSSGFIVPRDITNEINQSNVDMSQAIKNLGLTQEEKIGYGKGYIGMMTNDVSSRKQYMMGALDMAMMQYNAFHQYNLK